VSIDAVKVEVHEDRPYATLIFDESHRAFVLAVIRRAWGERDGATEEVKKGGFTTLRDLDSRALRDLESACWYLTSNSSYDVYEWMYRMIREAAQALEYRDLVKATCVTCPNCGTDFQPGSGWRKT